MVWNTANDAVLAEGRRVLIADTTRFEGVAVIGVDEHVWRHTRKGDKYVTVVIDLTPSRLKTAARYHRLPGQLGPASFHRESPLKRAEYQFGPDGQLSRCCVSHQSRMRALRAATNSATSSR